MKRDHRIELTGQITEVTKLNEWLDAVLSKDCVDRGIGQDLKLCLNEAVANIASYGFVEVSWPKIIIELHLSRLSAQAIIEDNGAYFDLRGWPIPVKPTDLESVTIGGFGISLIRDRASKIEYVRAGEWNRLTLTCGTISLAEQA